jgi:hypothetical protein
LKPGTKVRFDITIDHMGQIFGLCVGTGTVEGPGFPHSRRDLSRQGRGGAAGERDTVHSIRTCLEVSRSYLTVIA